MSKRILIVLTSHDQLGDTGEKTGFWLEEFAAPYYTFKDAGAEITLASPKGGQPPVDPKSELDDFQTNATRRFNADTTSQTQLAETLKLSEVNASDYDAIFYPGGHGPLWDLVTDQNSIQLIESFWEQNKPVSAVCHAPIVLVNANDENSNPVVKDREVTGFSNDEETAVGLTDVVPMLVENQLIEKGGKYSKAENFTSYMRVDGNLITGQNPASSEPVALAVLQLLNSD